MYANVAAVIVAILSVIIVGIAVRASVVAAEAVVVIVIEKRSIHNILLCINQSRLTRIPM